MVPRDCRPKGRSPSFGRVPVPVLISGRKRPRRSASRLSIRVVSCISPIFTHNEHRVTGYRTLAALASDSPPRRPLLRRECQDPARPDPPRQAATALDAPRVPATRTPPAESCIRFAPPLFSFWQPQRAVKGRIARAAWRRLRGLIPLTARFAAAPPRASRSEPPRLVDITNRSLHCVWIRQREFAS